MGIETILLVFGGIVVLAIVAGFFKLKRKTNAGASRPGKQDAPR